MSDEETKEKLWDVLGDLDAKQLTKFQWLLKLKGIKESALNENTTIEQTVDLMVGKYCGEAIRVTLDILPKIGRKNLVPRLEGSSSGLTDVKKDSGGQKEEGNQSVAKVDLKSVQKFAVEVTLDADTAHPHLILSDDRKQVYHGDVRRKLPETKERFDSCINVLGEQGFSSGRFYFEVEVKGKTGWALGVAKQSINRQGEIAAKPKHGYWTIMLSNGDKYHGNDNVRSPLSINQPQKVGIFVDYEDGLVSFYDVDSAAHLHSFTECDFDEILYPFFTPFKNDNGKNSAPLIITPMPGKCRKRKQEAPASPKEEQGTKLAVLKSIQQFAVDVSLDPDTAHPALNLTDDGKQVNATTVYKNLPDNPKRFDRCVNVLGKQGFSSGKHYFEVQVKNKTSWTVGVAKESINRKGSITLNPENGFWTIWMSKGNKYEAINDPSERLSLKSKLQKVGVFVDYEDCKVSFYDAETADHLYSFTGCSFTEKLLPYFSPRTCDNGENSAPLIIVSFDKILKRRAKLKKAQEYAVEVTLDPDTAHPALAISADGKQVYDEDVRKKLPFSSKRFRRCVNVLAKQSFSSGKFYFEVQVKGKTAWTVGLAKESIDRKGDITLHPEGGFWTIWLRNGDQYKANENPAVRIAVKSKLQMVGVFTDYDAGLVSFYDVESGDLLHSFTDCNFSEKIYPYFSPCTCDDGKNSAPLIISSLDNMLTCDSSDQKEDYERKKVELKAAQQNEVEVTLDPDTAHPALNLSDDGKQVYCTEVYKKLPDNPKRFDRCVNVLGKQSFSAGKFYFEVQVQGKTDWTLGLARESIKRKGKITLCPDDGFWTISLEDRNEYSAQEDPSVCFSVKANPKRVGVLGDYEKGTISFYDVDSADCLYSFTGCSFRGKLLPFFCPSTIDGGTNSAPLVISLVRGKENEERKKAELRRIQQFAVDITLDEDTANPYLVLSSDGKQVYDSDKKRKVPKSSQRFEAAGVLGKESFSSGRAYFEVQVKGKIDWSLGLVSESVNRGGKIILSPEDGFWTIWLRKEVYTANDDNPVRLVPHKPPEKIGVFLDYEKGSVSFYDADLADHLYSYTECAFSEKLYPFFSPSDNDKGKNAAPLIISPVNHLKDGQKHDSRDRTVDVKKKKAELKRLQTFAVDVTLDPETANPYLILSDDGKQVHDTDVRKKLPDTPRRFDSCVDVLGKQGFSSGQHYYEVEVRGKTAWSLGMASESVNRKGKITLSPEDGFWTIWLRNKDEYTANDYRAVSLSVSQPLQKVGIFVDYDEGIISFYDAVSADLLYAYTGCTFCEKIYPFFSPSANDHGTNSAPLIISPVNRLTKEESVDQLEDGERKKRQLDGIREFAVEVTLDPNTADPYLILSDDGKQVHHGDVRQKLPEHPNRFDGGFSVLGKQGFSSGRFYYEVQVQGKTDWTIGVAKESAKRKGNITLSPEDGLWTIWLRNEEEYEAIDYPSVHLSVKSPLQTVGVFVDYAKGVVSFYDVDSADLLYSFKDCEFSEKVYPFFNPCTNDAGKNSAPLIISPVCHPKGKETPDPAQHKREAERKKDELKRVRQFAVEVTLDPDTTHPHLILSADRRQVRHGDVRQKLPYNSKRFRRCVNVVGKESFSEKFYFEVEVKGKTAWTVGVANESIERKGDITLCPDNGFWTVWLRNGDEYEAIDDPSVSLSVKQPLQKVGVFTDFAAGTVSFYDVETADLLYTFTECSFTEKLLPYFSPCTNDKGQNSAPLTICPVSTSG